MFISLYSKVSHCNSKRSSDLPRTDIVEPRSEDIISITIIIIICAGYKLKQIAATTAEDPSNNPPS